MAFSLLWGVRCVGKPARTWGLRPPLVSQFDVPPEVHYHFSTHRHKTSSHTTPVSSPSVITAKKRERKSKKKNDPSPDEAILTKNSSLSDLQYPTTSPLAREILKENWGHSSFRLEQEAVISRLLDGGSAVAIFPTGAGKSLLYQVSALGFDQRDKELGKPVNPGITLVISPLIALIKDQTQDLQARGISAAAIDSSQPYKSILKVYDQIKNNQLKILYCSPERLLNERFTKVIRQTTVRMVAVDEAHCVLEWGTSFRPDYLKIARFLKEMKVERVLCVTATATQNVALQVCSAFGVPVDGLFRSSSYRPNLQLLAKFFEKSLERMAYLETFIRENPGATIIYVTTRAQSEFLAQELVDAGIQALPYHAGMDSDTRSYNQDQFMKNTNITIVATIAFGLGINKPDIRNIIHCCAPMSLERYSQEIGRAGRDGKPSKCITLICQNDLSIQGLLRRSDMTTKNDIKRFFKKIFKENKTTKVGDIIETSHLAESKDLDIEMKNLHTLYAKLELNFKFIRELAPRYGVYTYSGSLSSVKSKIARAIEEFSTGESSLKSIDIDSVRDILDIKRDDILRKLDAWDFRGVINLRCAGSMSRYRVLQPFDRTKISELTKKTHDQLKSHIDEQLLRSKKFTELITAKSCFAHKLAEHFGDMDSVPETGCKNCQYCLTGKRVVIQQRKRVEQRQDIERIDAILTACPERDDPELLAKIAFGIRSPRVVRAGFGPKSKVFGSMSDFKYEDLVKGFSKACKS